MDKDSALKKIKEEILGLENSPLYKERVANHVFPVIGEGDHNAKVMFIGEAPGEKEAKSGRPFCGTAGKLLDWCLSEIGVDRKETYITNIVKDRPPKNRDPYPEEIDIYSPFLDRQIDIIQPEIIATLGRFSAEYMLVKMGLADKVRPITQLHGSVLQTKTNYGSVRIVPLLHPAAAIHNPTQKNFLLEGFKSLKQEISR